MPPSHNLSYLIHQVPDFIVKYIRAPSTSFPIAATILKQDYHGFLNNMLASPLCTQQHEWSSKNVNVIILYPCLKYFIDVILKKMIKEDPYEDSVSEVRPTRLRELGKTQNSIMNKMKRQPRNW